MSYNRQKYVAIASILCISLTFGQEAQAMSYSPNTRQVLQDKAGQKQTLTGRVTDANGEELIGAVVKVVGTASGAVTDIDGKFSLTFSGKQNTSISVSMIGYVTKTVRAAEAQNGTLNIVLQEDNQALEEVVVVGYGAIKKESLTSAISNIKSEDLARTAAINTSGALAGKIPGINSRQSDGRPGQWTSISIRNMGTPLYVVDGVQMDEGQFNNIDYNDIENISVLKDASASIYGVRAANGVVVVTTKSGKRNQKCRINLNSYYGWQCMFRSRSWQTHQPT